MDQRGSSGDSPPHYGAEQAEVLVSPRLKQGWNRLRSSRLWVIICSRAKPVTPPVHCTMLPLQPVDYPELSTEQELSMTQDVADQFFDWINDDLCEMLHDHIADVLKANNIDLDSALADDLFIDIAKRISVDVNVSK